jgi:hypothetical protein
LDGVPEGHVLLVTPCSSMSRDACRVLKLGTLVCNGCVKLGQVSK